MEDLLGNPIIIALIIGMISSFFGKKKENSKTQSSKNKETKAKGKIQQQYAEVKKTATKAKQMDRKRPVSARTQQNAAMLEEKIKTKEPIVRELIVRDSGIGKEPSLTEGKNKPELKKDGESLLNGLIWAEVIGPPRAKKPVRSRR